MYMYIYICIYMYIYMYMYIYVYVCICNIFCLFIYVELSRFALRLTLDLKETHVPSPLPFQSNEPHLLERIHTTRFARLGGNLNRDANPQACQLGDKDAYYLAYIYMYRIYITIILMYIYI